jgi:hypothetical protein
MSFDKSTLYVHHRGGNFRYEGVKSVEGGNKVHRFMPSGKKASYPVDIAVGDEKKAKTLFPKQLKTKMEQYAHVIREQEELNPFTKLDYIKEPKSNVSEANKNDGFKIRNPHPHELKSEKGRISYLRSVAIDAQRKTINPDIYGKGRTNAMKRLSKSYQDKNDWKRSDNFHTKKSDTLNSHVAAVQKVADTIYRAHKAIKEGLMDNEHFQNVINEANSTIRRLEKQRNDAAQRIKGIDDEEEKKGSVSYTKGNLRRVMMDRAGTRSPSKGSEGRLTNKRGTTYRGTVVGKHDKFIKLNSKKDKE